MPDSPREARSDTAAAPRSRASEGRVRPAPSTRPVRRGRPSQAVLRRRRAVAVLAVGLIVALVSIAVSGSATRSGNAQPPLHGRQTVAPRRTGHGETAPRTVSYRVATFTTTLEEPSAAAVADARSPSGAPVRAIPVTVRYPVRGPGSSAPPGRLPLVIFSPGFDIASAAYAGLLDAWVRSGFVVAEPSYPLTAPSVSGVAEGDIVNHPRDLRYVITQLLAQTRQPDSRLDGRIDAAAIAVAGHSDGGDVSLAVASDSCCSDARVKSAVILSGAQLSAFGGRYNAGRHVPLLVAQGSADTVNLPACSVQIYNQSPPPKTYLDLIGAGHEPPYLLPGPDRRGVDRVVVAFLRATLERRPASLDALRRPGALGPGAVLGSPTTVPAPAGGFCPGAP